MNQVSSSDGESIYFTSDGSGADVIALSDDFSLRKCDDGHYLLHDNQQNQLVALKRPGDGSGAAAIHIDYGTAAQHCYPFCTLDPVNPSAATPR